MHALAASIAQIGLRHLVVDGLKLLDGQPLERESKAEEKRKTLVLSELLDLTSQAKWGSEMAAKRALFAAADEVAAYKTYTLVIKAESVRRLTNGKRREYLKTLYEFFKSQQAEQVSSKKAKKLAAQWLREMCDQLSIQRERKRESSSRMLKLDKDMPSII